jgi:tetratricopeptide (TPR) repeat protein
MKRTERHHLKEDEMAHGLSWLVQFVGKYRREILTVAGALAFAAVVFAGLLIVRAHGRSVQSRAVGEVGDLAAAAVEKPEKLADLEKLAAKGRTARLANLELARYWAERGDWAKAESFAGRIPEGRKDLLHYQAEDLKAQIALGRKDFDKAIAIYKKAVDEKPKIYPIDALLFRLAESHELKGETKEALDLYKKLQEEHTQSYFGYEASLKAGKLGQQK